MGGVEHFCERFCDLLGESDISLKDVAAATGIKLSRLYDFKSGKHAPSFDNAVKLKELFGCTFDYMFGFTDDYARGTHICSGNVNGRLKTAIDQSKCSRCALSAKTGIDQAQLARWYGGKRPSPVSSPRPYTWRTTGLSCRLRRLKKFPLK